MSLEMPLVVDHSQLEGTAKFVQCPIIHSNHQARWQNIHLAYYQLPAMEIPEVVSLQHIICLPSWKQKTEVELTVEGKYYLVQNDQQETGHISILPAHLPIKAKWSQASEFTHCYLEPNFFTNVAYESVHSEQVEVSLTIKKYDPLIQQIVLELKAALETDAKNSRLYAESMAIALAAHCLRYYSTRKHILQDYADGLSKYKLKQAIEYINDHFTEDVSIAAIANELSISQYYFSRLFKQSTGITPHTYLVQQRVEHSKQLLKQAENTINEIAIECGFANPSHFAKCFRRYTGMSPKQFRMI